MLETLRLIDFKSFVDETIIFSPVTFLVGANAAGKSNALDALRLLQKLVSDRDLSEILDGEEGSAPDGWKGIRGGAREAARYGTMSFAIQSSWKIAGDEILTAGGHRIRVQVKPSVKLLEEGAVDEDGHEVFTFGESETRRSVLWTLLGGQNGGETRVSEAGARVVGAVSDGLGRTKFVDIQPDRMRDLSHRGPPLRDDGANLSGVLHALCSDSEIRKTFIEWVAELCAPELQDLDFIEVEELGDVMVVLVERDGRRISARSMSDGTLRFLGILAALYTSEPDSVLCFEELSAGLHPARVRLLLELLETVHRERGVQTIVTTHNPSLLRWLDDERLGQVVLLARTPEHAGTVARRLGDVPGFFDATHSLGLEEMFASQWLEVAL